MSIATSIHGPIRFKHELIDLDSDFKLSDLYFQTMIYINIALGVFLIYWWMSQGYSSNPWFTDQGRWNWIDTYSNASIVTQWGTVILIGLVLNRFLYHKFCKD
jgi:NSS family neurotransmitter:Na+ symporter